MGAAIGEVLPFAIVIAASPIPIIAIILMLFSTHARQNGLAFFAGWLLGILAVTLIALLIADGADAGTDEDASDLVDWIKLGLGLVLLFLALKQFQGRPKAGVEPELPGWMNAVDSFTPSRAFGIGIVLAVANPKSLIMAIAAGASIAQAALDSGEIIVVLTVFIALSVVSVLAPVLYYLFDSAGAKSTLDGWKTWLIANNATVMTVVLLLMGVVLFGRALSGLTS
jgi:threonine/homoserine/homoserine lactone efflux protein